MNLFESLIKLNENDENITNKFIEAEIPFEDNLENDMVNKIGRFTLYNGLIEIFEPTEETGYKAMLPGEVSDASFVIDELKEAGVTTEQINVIRSLVEDRFVTFDDEDIHEAVINAFTPEETDEITIEEELIKIEDVDKIETSDYKLTRRIEYIQDTLKWIEEEHVPKAVYPLVSEMYKLAVQIEDEMQLNKRN